MPMTNDRLQAGSAKERGALLAGRVAVLYALSQYYLFLPFAALCMAATRRFKVPLRGPAAGEAGAPGAAGR